MQHSSTLFVGLDVHKEAISVAYVAGDQGAEVGSLGAPSAPPSPTSTNSSASS